MNRKLTSMLSVALLGAAGFAQANPAIYQGGALTIPNGAIVTPDRQDYFTNIVLSADAQGRLSIVDATKQPLATVEEVEAIVNDDDSVTLEVSGYKSLECVSLLEPAVAYTNAGILVLLAETVPGPEVLCAAVTGPFTIDVELDTSGLESGEHDVRVNDFDLTIELP